MKGESLAPAREAGKLRRGEGEGNSYFRQGGHTTIILHPDCPECLLAAVNLRNVGGEGKNEPSLSPDPGWMFDPGYQCQSCHTGPR